MQRRKKSFFILTAIVVLPLAVQADTTYDISFTDTTSPATFSNASGTFTVNAANQVIGFNATFDVLKSFSFSGGSYAAGTQLIFDSATITDISTTTYNPTTRIFNLAFGVIEVPASNNGAYLDISLTNGSIYYDIGPWVAPNGFFEYIDGGTYTTSGPVNTSSTPEPASAALLLLGSAAFTLTLARKDARRKL